MRYDTFFRKLAAVCAAMILCLSVTACGILEAPAKVPDSSKGYFRDITNIWGAVVGTSYENATNEINVRVMADADELSVLATFVDPVAAPYSYVGMLGIAEYQIMDRNGKTVQEGSAESAEVVDGQIMINIDLDGLDSGSYTLIVTAFVAGGTGEQPLNINGSWECNFSL